VVFVLWHLTKLFDFTWKCSFRNEMPVFFINSTFEYCSFSNAALGFSK
jgi:hypothetical protein